MVDAMVNYFACIAQKFYLLHATALVWNNCAMFTHLKPYQLWPT